MPILLHMLAAYTPSHRCFVPSCDNAMTTADNEDFISFAIPKAEAVREFLTDGGPFDKCHMYSTIDGDQGCQPSNFNHSVLPEPCQRHIYDRSEFPETLTTKFDLVCDRESERRFLGTIMMLGFLLGSMVGGRLGDVFGRKRSMFLAVCVIAPSVIMGGFAPSYAVYATLRLISCTCLPIIWVSFHSCSMEAFSARHRVTVACLLDFFWPLTLLKLFILGYFFRHWTALHVATGCVCLIALASWWFTPESLRWLAQNNRLDEALDLFKKMARENNKELDKSKIDHIRDILKNIESVSQERTEKALTVLDLFKKGYAASSLVQVLAWVTSNVANYTLALNATKLSGDVFVNLVLTAVADMPAALIMLLTLNRLGRKANVSFFMILLGFSCLILAFLPKTQSKTLLIVFLVGKLAAGAALHLNWVVTSELYPTNLRGQSLGTFSTLARLFGLVCPFVADLAVFWKPLPMLVLGLPAVLAGFLILALLPETSNTNLPQNMEEGFKLNNISGESATSS